MMLACRRLPHPSALTPIRQWSQRNRGRYESRQGRAEGPADGFPGMTSLTVLLRASITLIAQDRGEPADARPSIARKYARPALFSARVDRTAQRARSGPACRPWRRPRCGCEWRDQLRAAPALDRA